MIIFWIKWKFYISFSIFKNIEVSISSDSKDTMNRTTKFFWKTQYKSMICWVSYPGESIKNPPKHDSLGYSIILHGFSLAGVWYPGESISPEYHTQGVMEPNFSSYLPWGRIPWWVKLTRFAYPGESPQGMISRGVSLPRVCDPGSQQPFLKTFAQPFKGTVSQK